MQIFCNIVMFVNLIMSTAWLIFLLKQFPEKIKNIDLSKNKKKLEVETYRFHTYEIELVKIFAKLLPCLLISILTCLGDGLSDETILWIPLIVAAVCIFVLAFVLTLYFCQVRFVCDIQGREIRRDEPWVSIAIGLVYAILLSQSVYTIILLCI